jgi:hypothetical protein
MVHRYARLFCLFFIPVIAAVLLLAHSARAQGSAPVQPNPVVITFSRGTGASSVGIGPSNRTASSAVQASSAASTVEGVPLGPSALVYDQGKFYILDSLNGIIIEQDPQTGKRQDIPLPDGYFADMTIQAKTLYLRDFNRPGLLALDQSSGQPVPARSSLGSAKASSDLAALADLTVKTTHTDNHQGMMTIFDAHQVQLAVLSIHSEHYLGSATLQGRDSSGNYYVMVEELLENVPEMMVDTSVRRYAPDGTFLDAAFLPMDEIYFFPNRPVAVDPQGGAYFLKVTQDQAEVVRLDFSDGTPSTLEKRWEAIQPSVQPTPHRINPFPPHRQGRQSPASRSSRTPKTT